MGRGQTMSMIYDPEKDCLDGCISVSSGTYMLHNFRVDEELSFEMDRCEKVTGTVWGIVSNKPKFFSVPDIEDHIRRNVRTDIAVLINGRQVDGVQPRGEKIETEKCTVWFDKRADGFRLFDRSIYVTTLDVVKGWGGTIVTKVAVKQNFARNDYIEGDSVVGEVLSCVVARIVSDIDSLAPNSRLNDDKRRGIIRYMYDNPAKMNEWSDLKVFSLTNGRKVSLRDIGGKEVHSGRKGDVTADAIIQRGAIVLDDGFRMALSVVGKKVGKSISHYKQASQNSIAGRYLYGRAERHHNDIQDYNREQLALHTIFNSAYIHGGREIKFGKSDVSDGWTDGRTYVYLNWAYVKKQFDFYRHSGIMSVLWACHGLIAHEMAHNNNDMVTTQHGYEFDRNEIKWRDKQTSQLLSIPTSKVAMYERDLGKQGKVAASTPTDDGGAPKWFREVMEKEGATVIARKGKVVAKVINGRMNWATCKRRSGKWVIQLDLERETADLISVDDPKAKEKLCTYIVRTK